MLAQSAVSCSIEFAGLRRLADVTPFAVLMRLVVALVIPFFIYCDFVYFALDSYSQRKLTVAFNA
jgi:hypothetical protein